MGDTPGVQHPLQDGGHPWGTGPSSTRNLRDGGAPPPRGQGPPRYGTPWGGGAPWIGTLSGQGTPPVTQDPPGQGLSWDCDPPPWDRDPPGQGPPRPGWGCPPGYRTPPGWGMPLGPRTLWDRIPPPAPGKGTLSSQEGCPGIWDPPPGRGTPPHQGTWPREDPGSRAWGSVAPGIFSALGLCGCS